MGPGYGLALRRAPRFFIKDAIMLNLIRSAAVGPHSWRGEQGPVRVQQKCPHWLAAGGSSAIRWSPRLSGRSFRPWGRTQLAASFSRRNIGCSLF